MNTCTYIFICRSFSTQHTQGRGDTYCKLIKPLKTPSGTLVSWLLSRRRNLWVDRHELRHVIKTVSLPFLDRQTDRQTKGNLSHSDKSTLTRKHTHTYTNVHTRTQTHTDTHKCTHTYTNTQTSTQTHTHATLDHDMLVREAGFIDMDTQCKHSGLESGDIGMCVYIHT